MKKRILEIERESTRSHVVEKFLWKRLCTCHKRQRSEWMDTISRTYARKKTVKAKHLVTHCKALVSICRTGLTYRNVGHVSEYIIALYTHTHIHCTLWCETQDHDLQSYIQYNSTLVFYIIQYLFVIIYIFFYFYGRPCNLPAVLLSSLRMDVKPKYVRNVEQIARYQNIDETNNNNAINLGPI